MQLFVNEGFRPSILFLDVFFQKDYLHERPRTLVFLKFPFSKKSHITKLNTIVKWKSPYFSQNLMRVLETNRVENVCSVCDSIECTFF